MLALCRPGTWSLKTKFALCSGALMCVFSIAFTTWTLHNVELDVHGSVVDAQLALVRFTAADLDAKVELRHDAMTTIAALLGKSSPDPGAPMEEFFRPRPVLKKMFDVVLMTDARGNVIYDFPSGAAVATIGDRMESTDFFQRLQHGSTLVISSPFTSPANHTPYIAFAAPLRSSNGTVNGALVGLLNLSHGNFIGDLGNERIGRDGYFSIVELSDKPQFVLHRRTELIATAAPGGTSHPIIVGALKGHEGTVEGTNAYGVESLRTYMPLRSVPWVLVAMYPANEAFAGLQARKEQVLGVGACLFLLASGAAWLLTQWLLRPLERLQSSIARHVSEPGLRIDPPSYGSFELSELALAYNVQAAARKEATDRLHASEQRVREIVDHMPASVLYFDENERCTFANARAASEYRGADAQVHGKTMSHLRGDAGYSEIATHVATALRGQTVSFETREFVEGSAVHSQSHFIPDIDGSGQVRGFYKMKFDITALKEAQGRQALVEQRLRAITDHLPALIAHLDKEERYDFLNDTFRLWLGIDPAAAIGRHMIDVIGNDVYAMRRERVARCLAGEPSRFEMEVQTLVGRKTLRIEYLPDMDSSGAVAGFYTFSSDVTELKEVQLRLSKLVRSDSLTGLYNRLQFEESLPLSMARSRRTGSAMALMFLDIDHFKLINDSLGHHVGDEVLKEFSRCLCRCVRATDTVARLGGDEFVVILEGLHARAEAAQVAQIIIDDVRKPLTVFASVVRLTTSIGIAFWPRADVAEDATALLKRADAALYAAKSAGRNQYHSSSD